MSWQRQIQRVLTTGLILSALYVTGVFIERALEPTRPRPRPESLPLSSDYYVALPKSYLRDFTDAQALAGKALWVREGYRWLCQPGEALGPMEEVVVRRAFREDGQVWLEVARDQQPACSLPISSGGRFFLDDIFLIKDPHQVYKDWTQGVWTKIAEHRAEPGMTEAQITFALGYGESVRELSEPGGAHRVVDYIHGERSARVTYAYGVAKQVEPLASR
jgi:hypothetical protein